MGVGIAPETPALAARGAPWTQPAPQPPAVHGYHGATARRRNVGAALEVWATACPQLGKRTHPPALPRRSPRARAGLRRSSSASIWFLGLASRTDTATLRTHALPHDAAPRAGEGVGSVRTLVCVCVCVFQASRLLSISAVPCEGRCGCRRRAAATALRPAYVRPFGVEPAARHGTSGQGGWRRPGAVAHLEHTVGDPVLKCSTTRGKLNSVFLLVLDFRHNLVRMARFCGGSVVPCCAAGQGSRKLGSLGRGWRPRGRGHCSLGLPHGHSRCGGVCASAWE
jgi:hypothetical protein